jgi:hypothetical protein
MVFYLCYIALMFIKRIKCCKFKIQNLFLIIYFEKRQSVLNCSTSGWYNGLYTKDMPSSMP